MRFERWRFILMCVRSVLWVRTQWIYKSRTGHSCDAQIQELSVILVLRCQILNHYFPDAPRQQRKRVDRWLCTISLRTESHCNFMNEKMELMSHGYDRCVLVHITADIWQIRQHQSQTDDGRNEGSIIRSTLPSIVIVVAVIQNICWIFWICMYRYVAIQESEPHTMWCVHTSVD